MRTLLVSTLLLLVALPACARGRKGLAPVRFDGHTLWVEVVADDMSRSQGLMFRHELGEDEGMLFVFDEPHEASFWMRNTPLPLSIAFLDEHKVVLNVERMVPYDDRTYHRSKGLAVYAVEANQGWFEKRGIGPGTKAQFEVPAAAGR